MTKKVLAAAGSRRIAVCFKNEREYEDFCGLIMSQCVDEVMKSLSLDEVISLWKEKNEPVMAKSAVKRAL